MRALGRAFLGDSDFFFLWEFSEGHAEGGAEVVVCGCEDVFEFAAGVGGHDCMKLGALVGWVGFFG